MGLLCLTRGIDDVIVIDPGGLNIRIVVIDIRGDNRARIGIDCPRHIKVHRAEIVDRIDRGERRRDGTPDGGQDTP